MSGCLNCKHYNPNPRWQSTPVCMHHRCEFEPLTAQARSNPTTQATCEGGTQSARPSPERDDRDDFNREYDIAPWAFDGD